MGRVAIFIDGGYFEYVQRAFGEARVQFDRMAAVLALALRGWDRQSGRPIFEQKRVDIKLAVDLVLLASKRQITRAVLVTGDSDFLPAILAAKNEGVVVTLCHGVGENRPHRDLWDSVDVRTPITEPLMASFAGPAS